VEIYASRAFIAGECVLSPPQDNNRARADDVPPSSDISSDMKHRTVDA
jgi:hypothetical protein